MASERSVTRDDIGSSIRFVDEDGDAWLYVSDDMCGNYAVNHAELRQAGMIVHRPDDSYDFYCCGEGAGFSANNPTELIVCNGSWVEND